MKFYFCESCGKRLTEQDLASGQARDKQVKGVYCENCSQSVMTVEFNALREDQARELIRDAQAETVTRPTPERQSPSSHTLRTASERRARNAAPADRSGRPRNAPRNEATGGKGVLIGGGIAAAVVVVVVILLALVLGGGKPRPPRESAHAKAPATPAPAAATPDRTPPHAAPPVEALPARPAAHATNTPAVETAEQDFDKMNAALAAMPDATLEEKKALANKFLADHGDSLEASRVRVMVRGWEAPPPAPEPVAQPVATPAAAPPVGDGARVVVFDGKDKQNGGGWHTPNKEDGTLEKVDDPDRPGHVLLKFNPKKHGYAAFGWNWHSWGPGSGTNIGAATHLHVRIKIEAQTAVNGMSFGLRANSSDHYYTAKIEKPSQYTDGVWRAMRLPLTSLSKKDGVAVDPARLWEVKFEWYAGGPPMKVWISDLWFE